MKLYVTEWQPNGTNSLVLVDDDGQVVSCLDRALFGVNVRFMNLDRQTVLSEDQILSVESDEYRESEGTLLLIEEIEPEVALERLAISPVSDGSEARDFIMKHFKISA